jgi:hypothetical protein
MTTTQPTDLAQHVAWLEQVLPKGYGLLHTRNRWHLRIWDSWTAQIHGGYAEPRMGWRDVDSDKSLAELLDRLGERS